MTMQVKITSKMSFTVEQRLTGAIQRCSYGT